MAQARGGVSQGIEFTRDVVGGRHITVKALMQGQVPKDSGRGGGGRGRALAGPKEGGKIVGRRVDRAFANIKRVCRDIEVPEVTQQFKFRVGEAPVRLSKRPEVRANVGRERNAPYDGVRRGGTLPSEVKRAVRFAGEEFGGARGGQRGREPDSTGAGGRGVVRADSDRRGRDQLV